MNTFGQRLRAAREERQWTQEFVGQEVEVTNATVSKWERDAAEPSLKHLQALGRLFCVSIDALVRDDVAQARGLARFAGTQDERGVYRAPDPSKATNSEELALLMHFRRLGAKRRRAVLDLINPDT